MYDNTVCLLFHVFSLFKMIFRKHGWRKILYLNPKYRSKAVAYDFDKYSSKGSAVHPVKKLNIHNQVLGAWEQAPPAVTSAAEGENGFLNF